MSKVGQLQPTAIFSGNVYSRNRARNAARDWLAFDFDQPAAQ